MTLLESQKTLVFLTYLLEHECVFVRDLVRLLQEFHMARGTIDRDLDFNLSINLLKLVAELDFFVLPAYNVELPLHLLGLLLEEKEDVLC